MSDEIKFPNGMTIKFGAKGEPLQGVTPASLDELLKEWEATAKKRLHYSGTCAVNYLSPVSTELANATIALIAVVRKQAKALEEITNDVKEDISPIALIAKYDGIALKALTESERILRGHS